ncbi:hypothetical protein A5719_28630 [Mycolicibacterium peregrinum]|uniref:hypothetical protein n=1 Tax=Mycolicibacterium peregrinum TaxID=43304 RepID=UPI0007E9AACF|nr:hypothetical protein [Mycolicibacterium peregrinum]OBF32597.1 hypothetical protein A5719_28630 [Mycolicibacterium peregrinum]
MSLSDPRAALARQSSFLGYLVGLAAVSRAIHTLAGHGSASAQPRPADDFVHALLGLASLGTAVERLAESAPAQPVPAYPPDAVSRWLR